MVLNAVESPTIPNSIKNTPSKTGSLEIIPINAFTNSLKVIYIFSVKGGFKFLLMAS